MSRLAGKIVYSCPFVPAEWIRAHGFAPSRVISRISGMGISSPNGVCPYTTAFLEAIRRQEGVSGVIFTTACDQMRRAAEAAAAGVDLPVFLMNVPHTWQSAGSYRFYIEELHRLGRYLCEIGGTEASNLPGIMLDYDQARACIRDSRSILTPRQFSELIADFNRRPDVYVGVNLAEERIERQQGVPVALLGGPLARDSFKIFDIIEKAGGAVVLDATETGERSLPAPFDRRNLQDDPVGTLADAYFGSITDPFRRPNSEFFRWLGNMIESRGIKGLILQHYLWCDNWRAEVKRIADWSGLPMLTLDIGDGGFDIARANTRIEAFFEVLK